KILLPLAHVSEHMRQIPFVSVGNVSAGWNSRRHSEKDESGNQETKKRVNNSPLKIHGFLASRLIQLMDCRVSRNQFERALGECFAGWNFVPGRCAGRMRQRNQVEAMVCMHDAKFAANYVLQSSAVDELHDRQSAHRNNETWLQNPNLVIHPQRTVANFIWCWNAVGAAGIFARETAADGGEIDLRSDGSFVHSAKLFEPT